MQAKRISFTLFDKSLKQQLDNLIQADYGLLNQHPLEQQTILKCQLANNNPIIKQYIHAIEHEYNVPNPIVKHPQRVSSNKKIELSILNSSKDQSDIRHTDKNRKKLTLTTPNKESQLAALQKRQSNYQNAQISTPKFGHLQNNQFQKMHKMEENLSSSKKTHTNSANKLNSTQRPKGIKGQQSNLTTKKVINSFDQSQISRKSHTNLNSRATIKREYNTDGTYSESQIVPSQDYTHNNPIVSKIHKKKLQDYCRPSRIYNSVIKQQASTKLKIRDSYRYCVGCEHPILQANVRAHEKECQQFLEIASLSSNQQILKIVKSKIAKIEEIIGSKNSQLQDENLTIIRNRSSSLARESKSRPSCSPESPVFTKDYQAIMKAGSKLCHSLEQVNKLRWFTRIARRLEQILAQPT